MSEKRKTDAAHLHPDGHGHAHGAFGYHDHDDVTMGHGHSHGGGPAHEHPTSPGRYPLREELKSRRDYTDRAFTVGIGGPVGSGKTALVLSLCRALRDTYGLVVVTNDIFTKEDCEFLTKHQALPTGRIKAVETGGCPHAAIREDCSANLTAATQLSLRFSPDLCLIESGGDNLAANYSRELADYIIYVIDVAGGDKVPRKGGPGITQSDLLIINKTDLAELVGADLTLMSKQAHDMREGGPVVMAQVKHMVGIPTIIDHIITAWSRMTGKAPKHAMSTAPITDITSTSTSPSISTSTSTSTVRDAPPSASMDEISMTPEANKKSRVA